MDKEYFYRPLPIDIERERIIKPYSTPLQHLTRLISIIALLYLLHLTCQFYPPLNRLINQKILDPISSFYSKYPFLFFDTFIILFMMFFRSRISLNPQKTFKFFVVISLLFLLTHTIITYHEKEIFINQKNIFETTHLLTVWLFTIFFFNYLTNRYFIDIPFRIFLNMRTHIIKNVDLFTSVKEYTEHHTKNDIYIDIVPLAETYGNDEEFLKIQTMYLRLVKFWYAQKNYTFKLRYYFPLLITLGGLVYFFYLLNFINDIPDIEFDQQYMLMILSLTMLYLSMSHHIHTFLNSRFYMQNILQELDSTYFNNQEYRQQIQLFLDKNFLIYIHDKHQDTHFCLNESKDFQEFISQEKVDEEGRNLIVMVYISFFMILFIEVMVNRYQPPSDNNNSSPTSSVVEKKEFQT